MKCKTAVILFASLICTNAQQLGNVGGLFSSASNLVNMVNGGGGSNFGAGGFNNGINTNQGLNFNTNPSNPFGNTNGFTVNNGGSNGFNTNQNFVTGISNNNSPFASGDFGNSNEFQSSNSPFANTNNGFGANQFANTNNNAFGSRNAFGNNNNLGSNAFGNNNNINNNPFGTSNTNTLTGQPSLTSRLGLNTNNGGFQTGQVVGQLRTQNGVVIVDAEVQGGNPPPAVYVWRVQQPDGTTVDYPAGEGGSTAVTRGNNGWPSTSLTVTEPADIDRKFTLFVSSDPSNSQTWQTSQSWDAKPTISNGNIPAAPVQTPQQVPIQNQPLAFEPQTFDGLGGFAPLNFFGSTSDNAPTTDSESDTANSS